jgi:chorismate mutase
MRLNKKRLAFIAAWSICAQGRVYPQNPIDQLQPLVEPSAQRLVIAEEVALAKWDSGTAVEDPPREAQFIASAIRAGEARGLDQAALSSFFRGQIEAIKLVQYSLLAEWRRVGKAPDHTPVNLATAIRPELDQVEAKLAAELAKTASVRASESCRTDIAMAPYIASSVLGLQFNNRTACQRVYVCDSQAGSTLPIRCVLRVPHLVELPISSPCVGPRRTRNATS